MRLEDYDGPLRKTAVFVARKLERRTAHQPHYKPGAVLCSLETKDKFLLFVNDTLDPITFLAAGFGAGIDQAADYDPQFGQGGKGYAKRYGANFADQASSKFFKDFVYPSIFNEDPRYYRLGHGSGRRRFWHAIRHTFVAYNDSAKPMFNFSEWLGTSSSVALSNLYHPGNRRGFGPTSELVAISIGSDMGFDVLREFLPDISRKLKLPFIKPEPHEGPQPPGN